MGKTCYVHIAGRMGSEDFILIYQINLFKGPPDDEAISFIQYFERLALQYDPRGYCVCTSEGKDSRVLGHLFRRAGVKHFYLHSITGIDPPELTYFQRRNFQEYKDQGYLCYDIMPRKSMVRMMQERKIPPLRQARYCCSELKEVRTKEQGIAILSFGVRKYESVKRKKNRDEMEIVKPGKKQNVIMPFDNEENRREFEDCYTFKEKRVNPITYWTDADIWNYSEYWKLEQSELYKEGFKRLGCIGCPMAGECERKREFERWPGFKKMYLLGFEKMIEARKAAGLEILPGMETPEKWFDWWISDRAHKKKWEEQLELEMGDYEYY